MNKISANNDDLKKAQLQPLSSRRDLFKKSLIAYAAVAIFNVVEIREVFAASPKKKSANKKDTGVVIPPAGNGSLAHECGPLNPDGTIDCDTCGQALVDYVALPLLAAKLDELVEKNLIKSAVSNIKFQGSIQEARDKAISEYCRKEGMNTSSQRPLIVQSVISTLLGNKVSYNESFFIARILISGYPLPKSGKGGGTW